VKKIKWNLSEQIKLIESNFSITINSISKKSVGYNDALLVNNDLMFKFPTERGLMKRYEREKYINDNIRNQISFNVPNIQIIGNADKFFTYYKIIKGVDYWGFKGLKFNFWDLKDTAKDLRAIPNIANDISKFFVEFHMIDLIEIKKEKTIFSDRVCVNENLDIINMLLKQISDNKIKESFDYINEFETKQKSSDIVLLHGDSHGGNFILNKKTKRVVGIIDFELVKYGNYLIDLERVFATSLELFNQVAIKYKELTGRKVDIKYVKYLRLIRLYECIINHYKAERKENVKGYLKMIEKLQNEIL
jgi:hypothetical protein